MSEISTRHGGPIVVIGSINMDLVCRTEHIPKPGETILGSDLVTIPGGKGANQAVAAAKLVRGKVNGKPVGGQEVYVLGRVGDDDFGQRLLNGLNRHNVKTSYVTITEATASGCALILVDRKGENSIVVTPGANHKLSIADIDAAEGLLRIASVVILQLEIPMATVRHAIAACRRLGVFTILDPAPAPSKGLSRAVYDVDILSPNQSEAELLLGLHQSDGHATTKRSIDPKLVGMDLLSRGPRTVVLKLGKQGAMIVGRDGHIERVKGFKIKVEDSTAAGDAFTGALAVAHAEGVDLPRAVRFANAAGALCCTAFGAQPALPSRDAVEKMMNNG